VAVSCCVLQCVVQFIAVSEDKMLGGMDNAGCVGSNVLQSVAACCSVC